MRKIFLKSAVLAYIFFLFGSAQIYAQSSQGTNEAMSVYVNAQVLEKHCPAWKINTPQLEKFIETHHLAVKDFEKDGRFSQNISHLTDETEKLYTDIAKKTGRSLETLACDYANKIFGPKVSGQKANIMIEK